MESYCKVYYSGAVSSGFCFEGKNKEEIFNIGILQEDEKDDENMKFKYSYKVFSEISLHPS